MEEATEYISVSHVLGISSAHLLGLDTLTGLSTRPRQGTTDDYAGLLRVMPISELEKKWVFPQTELENAELSMIDANGDYILNKRLQISAREAESANKAKTDFPSTMSHDIRTPMNAIIGLTTIAEKNLGDTESTRESLRKISLASNHLLTLINDIPESRILSPEEFGLTDDAVTQLRKAVYGFSTGELTMDEAIAGFGTYE